MNDILHKLTEVDKKVIYCIIHIAIVILSTIYESSAAALIYYH